MRIAYLVLFLLIATPALAVEAPPGQVAIDKDHILRGRFAQESQIKGLDKPVLSSGHFVVAPGHGLIWDMEQPLTTATIITPTTSVQDLGGMTLKLPIKNLRHLYDMIGGALAGDWNALAVDYVIARSSNSDHWQMLLTPRPGVRPNLTYNSITVTGARFVEHIAMLKADGGSDTLDFSNTALGNEPLTALEAASFSKAGS